MPWSPNTKKVRRAKRKEDQLLTQQQLEQKMIAEAPPLTVLKPPMSLRARKKGGDYGRHQAALNFVPPSHVSSMTISREDDEPEEDEVWDETQKVGQFAIGLVYEGDWKADSKMAGQGKRTMCLDSQENIKFLHAVRDAVTPLVHPTLQIVVDETMRLTILCGAQTQPHTDSFRGNTPNMMYIRGTPSSQKNPGWLCYDQFPKFKTSVVELDGKLYIPHSYSEVSDEVRCIGASPHNSTKPFYYVFHKSAIDHMQPFGDLPYAVVGWTIRDGIHYIHDEGEVCIYRKPLTFNCIQWKALLDDARENRVNLKPRKRIVALKEQNKWMQFPAYKYRHWWVGNPMVVRYHVFFRSIRQTPVSSNIIRKGNRINYRDLSHVHQPKTRKRKSAPKSD